MRKFVELGHLRAADLVWCASFTEWQTGATAFPETFKPKSAPASPPVVAPPAPSLDAVRASMPAASPQVVPRPGAVASPAGPSPAPMAGSHPGRGTSQPAGGASVDTEWTTAMRAAIKADEPTRAPAYEMAPVPLGPPTGRTGPGAAALPAASPAAPAYRHEHAPYHPASPPAGTSFEATGYRHEVEDDVDDEEEEIEEAPRRRGWARRLTAAVAVLLILGGLGWIGWQNRALISGASAIGTMLGSRISGASAVETFRATPFQGLGETRDQIDAALQKTAVWRILKRDFAEWYDERLTDVEKMRAQKNDEKVISKFLADVIVTLRRRHAQSALQSSPDHMKRMATAFVANLKQLGSRDGETCHGFITFGEAHPFMIGLMQTPAFAETMQKQLVAVFDGISHGRANRLVYAPTRRQDYDVLTQELTTRGWTQQDLATFSDPQRLSKSPPDKVCSLVQEWFNTQLALKDADLQVRLLAESLKPLVGG